MDVTRGRSFSVFGGNSYSKRGRTTRESGGGSGASASKSQEHEKSKRIAAPKAAAPAGTWLERPDR
jgi:hypothetical protein